MSNLYFNHSYSLRNQTEILELRAEFGIVAYGLYNMLLETIAESETHSINRKRLKGLALNLGCDFGLFEKIINTCINLELFFEKDGFIFSNHLQEHFKKREEIREKRRKAGAKGGSVSKANTKQMLNNSLASDKQTEAKSSKESKESKESKNKEKEISITTPQDLQKISESLKIDTTLLQPQFSLIEKILRKVESEKTLFYKFLKEVKEPKTIDINASVKSSNWWNDTFIHFTNWKAKNPTLASEVAKTDYLFKDYNTVRERINYFNHYLKNEKYKEEYNKNNFIYHNDINQMNDLIKKNGGQTYPIEKIGKYIIIK